MKLQCKKSAIGQYPWAPPKFLTSAIHSSTVSSEDPVKRIDIAKIGEIHLLEATAEDVILTTDGVDIIEIENEDFQTIVMIHGDILEMIRLEGDLIGDPIGIPSLDLLSVEVDLIGILSGDPDLKK